MSEDVPGTNRTARYFWMMGGALVVALALTTCRDITRPFYGLHSWVFADGPWFARCHVRYGLGYTHGLKTQAVGDPPPENPRRYLNHPHLSTLISAFTMWILGVNVWALRVLGLILNAISLLLLLRILRHLFEDRIAILAGLIWVLMPITGYFGAGGTGSLTGFLAIWLYLVLVGGIPGGPKPGKRHLIGLAIVLFVMTQLAWNCYFWILAIGVHYVFRCIRRRHWPHWPLAVVLVVVPLVGATCMFLTMLAGFEWDVQRIIDLYTWRAAKGEMTARMKEFDWGAWLGRFWEHALTNFTFWVMFVAVIGLAQHVIRLGLAFLRDRARPRPGTQGSRRGTKSKSAGKGGPARKGEPSATTRPAGLFGHSPQLMLFLMPGAFQLLILRGALWPHQYWERPLGPFIAICAAMALVALWDLLRAVHRHVAVGAVVVVTAILALFCLEGTNYYFGIRWQHPDRIKLWEDLNAAIPPDKFLLTYDAEMDNLIVTQSQAKGPVMRGEPAWYIDRQIVESPERDSRVATYRRLSQAYMSYVGRVRQVVAGYREGRMDMEVAKARREQVERAFRTDIQRIFQDDLPALLAQIEQKRKTGRYPCYLVPGELYHPQLGPALALYLHGLNAELRARYPVLIEAPGRKGERKDGKFYRAGMRPYFVYDLTRKRDGENAP